MITSAPKKKYVCTNCGKEYVKWQGQCVCKKWDSLEEVVPEKKAYFMPRISIKKKLQGLLPTDYKTKLNEWFINQRKVALMGDMLCENCGCSVANQLNSKDEWVWRGTFAHLIPKSKYRSVSTEPNNRLILCLNSCHGQYDSSWDNARKMPVFGLALARFRTFRDKVKESTTKLPHEFMVDSF